MGAKEKFNIGNIVKFSKVYPITQKTMRVTEWRGVVVGFGTSRPKEVEVFWTNIYVSKKADRRAHTYIIDFIEKCDDVM